MTVKHQIFNRVSLNDRRFQALMESGLYPLSEFDHQAHLRLAYVCLISRDVAMALDYCREVINRLLSLNKVDPHKYHETITCAWLMTVRQRMSDSPSTDSFASFIRLHPELTDNRLIRRHYSEARLFSSLAREHFLLPDRQPFGWVSPSSLCSAV